MKQILITTIALLLGGVAVGSAAHAVGPAPPSDPSAEANAKAGAVSGSSSKASSSSKSSSGAVSGSSAVTGDSTAVAGDSTAVAGDSSAVSGDSSSTLSVHHKEVRQAPSVGLVVPQSTAPFQKCFGIGGSAKEGSGVIGWCWLQRDTYAASRAHSLSEIGLNDAAAKAYCSRRIHYQDFGSKRDCIEQLSAALRSEPQIVEVKDRVCEEKLERCSDVTRK